jgi:hypothetical protein
MKRRDETPSLAAVGNLWRGDETHHAVAFEVIDVSMFGLVTEGLHSMAAGSLFTVRTMLKTVFVCAGVIQV